MQEILVEHLGFASADVELVYFDVDPATGSKKCTLGQVEVHCVIAQCLDVW